MTASSQYNLTPGTYDIDAVHSEVGFSVRHMMVSKVRGRFAAFAGQIVAADQIEDSSVSVTIEAGSVDTGNAQRDGHLRSGDFFDAENNNQLAFVSTAITPAGGDWTVTGDLTIKGVTKSVDLKTEFGGAGPDAYGGFRSGFSATTEISRKEFGVDLEMPIEGGGVVVGDKISIALEVEAVLNAAVSV